MFHGHPKAAGSCRESHHRGWTYLAAQNLLSFQILPQQLQLRCQLLSPFSPLSQLTSQLVYCFLTAFQHLEREKFRVTPKISERSRLQDLCLLGNQERRRTVLKRFQWNSYTSYPGLTGPPVAPNTLGSSSPISVWLTHQADPTAGLARNKWTGKSTQKVMGISFKCTYTSPGFNKQELSTFTQVKTSHSWGDNKLLSWQS